MKNKGFTLVEIMAVLIIMGVLLVVTLPSVFNSLDNKKKREHEKIVDEIKGAAELYVTQNKSSQVYLDKIGTFYISYATLVTEGLINGNETDPLTSELWNQETYVKITKDSDSMSMTIEYKKEDEEPMPANISLTVQPLTLSTRENYFVDKLLEEVVATDQTGIDYKSSLIYKCKINKTGESNQDNCRKMKNEIGTHEITYILSVAGQTMDMSADITIE